MHNICQDIDGKSTKINQKSKSQTPNSNAILQTDVEQVSQKREGKKADFWQPDGTSGPERKVPQ